jgi:antitoxin component YwqK of YwqJK toxin-antitoxin module
MHRTRNGTYQTRTTPYIEGKVHGEAKTFYLTRNQKILMTTPFKEGQKHGVEKHFSQNELGVHGVIGDLVQTTPFKEGQLHGEEKKWNKKGAITEMTTFKEGHQIRFWYEGINSDVNEHNILQYKKRKISNNN